MTGDIIGGGAFSSALKKHVREGLRAIMTEYAACTVRNSFSQVRELGIEVLSDNDEPRSFMGETLTLEEVNLKQLEIFLNKFSESISNVDVVAIAVQDHGIFPEGMSNRRFRLQKTMFNKSSPAFVTLVSPYTVVADSAHVDFSPHSE